MFQTKVVVKIETHFVYNDNFFPKIMPFMRKCGKYCREGHGTDENMTHAYFILDT